LLAERGLSRGAPGLRQSPQPRRGAPFLERMLRLKSTAHWAVRFRVMRSNLGLRQTTGSDFSDEALVAFLREHPDLRNRVASIALAVENADGDLGGAGAAEERLIEEARHLGREALQSTNTHIAKGWRARARRCAPRMTPTAGALRRGRSRGRKKQCSPATRGFQSLTRISPCSATRSRRPVPRSRLMLDQKYGYAVYL